MLNALKIKIKTKIIFLLITLQNVNKVNIYLHAFTVRSTEQELCHHYTGLSYTQQMYNYFTYMYPFGLPGKLFVEQG